MDATRDADPPPSEPYTCITAPEVDLSERASATWDGNPSDFDMAVEVGLSPADVIESPSSFEMGVQTGEMTSEGALFWTRYSGSASASSLQLWVWRDAATAGSVLMAHRQAVGEIVDGLYVHERVSTLAPATVYQYAFVELNAMDEPVGRSRLGRVRTAPPSGSRLLTTAASTTCVGTSNEMARLARTPYIALGNMAMASPDMILHLGDVIYNDRMITLQEYRDNWVRNLGDPGYQSLLASAGMFATWDDHEVTNNWDGETIDPARLAVARQTYFEHLAVRPGPEGRIWRSHPWGDSVEVFVLDARSERQPSTRTSDNPVFVSQAQMDWLKSGLEASTAHFKVVLTSVNMTNLPGAAGWDIPLGYDDRWEGYGAQRVELLDHIVNNRIENVWFLAGDIHVGFVGMLEPEGPYSSMWEITVGPGASSVNPLGALYELNPARQPHVFRCDQFLFGHGRAEIETQLEFDPVANAVHVMFRDAVTSETLFDEWLQQNWVEG
jgi:alkaline phosphatase D